MTKSGSKFSQASRKERRKAKRRPILETFSCFLVIPDVGVHRLTVSDLSEFGVGFEVELANISRSSEIKRDEKFDVRFYINQSLYIPLTINVARTQDLGEGRVFVGAEFIKREMPTYQAFLAFITLLDRVIESITVEPIPG